jgi:hypothetical protein
MKINEVLSRENTGKILPEGEKEMAALVGNLRQLGKDVDEIGQYLEKSTGKKQDDITDYELQRILARGVGDAWQIVPYMDRDPELQANMKAAQKIMDLPFGADYLAGKARDSMPSGTYTVVSPGSEPMDIDVDITGSDLQALKRAAERGGQTFPKALDSLKSGDFSGALGRVVDKVNR